RGPPLARAHPAEHGAPRAGADRLHGNRGARRRDSGGAADRNGADGGHQPPRLRLADRSAPVARAVPRRAVARARRVVGGGRVPRLAQRARPARAGDAGRVMGRRHARIPIGAALAAGVACAMAGGAGSTPQAGGFAQALSPRAFAFPRDHGPHREFRQEWWYVTGNLEAATGERFGFELTFFRFALAPGAAPDAAQRPVSGVATPPPSSAWRTRQIYMAHFALTDVAAGRFRFARKLSREALALAGAQAAPFRVWIDDWSLEAASGAAVSGATWTLRAAQPGY